MTFLVEVDCMILIVLLLNNIYVFFIILIIDIVYLIN